MDFRFWIILRREFVEDGFLNFLDNLELLVSNVHEL